LRASCIEKPSRTLILRRSFLNWIGLPYSAYNRNLMPSLILWCFMLSATAIAQAPALPNPDPHAEDREALLKIFSEVEASINAQSLERMVQQMDPAAAVVWVNGEVSRGPAEILAYYDRMVKGSGRILNKYTTQAKLHGHARFLGNGDVAVADGSMEDEYTPVIRGPFRMSGKWTTTAAKVNGEWKVISLHLSTNAFNNVLLDEAKSALLYTTGGGLLAGALAGWFIGRRRKQAGK
jgi:hypothetical protein